MQTVIDSLHAPGTIDRLARLAARLMVGAMMACLAVTIVQFGERLAPEWNGSYLVVVVFLVSLESMYSHFGRSQMQIFSREWLLYRVTEWVVLLIFIKLSLYLAHGFTQMWVDLPLWAKNFGQYFFTDEFIMVGMVVFLVWMLSAEMSSELAELEDPEGYPPVGEVPYGLVSREQIRKRLADRILIVGALMIFVTALLRIDWQMSWLPGPPPRGGVYNLLAYFLFALALLSLTQFTTLRNRWLSDRIPFNREIASRWIFYSLLFILGLALISSLLPTGYSVGLLEIAGYLLDLLIAFFRLVWFILILPFLLLWFLLASLFSLGGKDLPKPELPTLPALPQDSSPGAPIPWLEALKSLFFWTVFIGVVIFSVRYYLREHPELAAALRQVALIQFLGGVWDWLRSVYGGVNRQMGAAIQSGLRRLRLTGRREGEPAGWRYLNPRRLGPRQQVQFFYLSMVRRGGEQGLTRGPSQTPYEYASTLQSGLPVLESDPEAKQEVVDLTERFVEARYSRHDITSEHASLARRAWERIRRALKERQRKIESRE